MSYDVIDILANMKLMCCIYNMSVCMYICMYTDGQTTCDSFTNFITKCMCRFARTHALIDVHSEITINQRRLVLFPILKLH